MKMELARGTCSEYQERIGFGMMLAYPIVLEEDDGTILVTSPDFPELTTFGDGPDDAMAHAVDALEEAIAARIHDRKDIPSPSDSQVYASRPALTSLKVILYRDQHDHDRLHPASGNQ